MRAISEQANELSHYGILGMKWGVRRYQNSDGSLTSAGKRRQQVIDSSREEGLRVAKGRDQAEKKGESVATALILAERKARESGKVDQSFLDNENISQKAKDKVIATANKTLTRSNSGHIQKGKESAHIFLKKVGDFGLPLLPVITISQGKQFGLGLGILSAGIKDKQVFIRETGIKLKDKKLYVESKKIT